MGGSEQKLQPTFHLENEFLQALTFRSVPAGHSFSQNTPDGSVLLAFLNTESR